jgi:hypothetical protein
MRPFKHSTIPPNLNYLRIACASAPRAAARMWHTFPRLPRNGPQTASSLSDRRYQWRRRRPSNVRCQRVRQRWLGWLAVHLRQRLGEGANQLREVFRKITSWRLGNLQPHLLMRHIEPTGDVRLGLPQVGTSSGETARYRVHHHQQGRPLAPGKRPAELRSRRRSVRRDQHVHNPAGPMNAGQVGGEHAKVLDRQPHMPTEGPGPRRRTDTARDPSHKQRPRVPPSHTSPNIRSIRPPPDSCVD